MRTATLLTSLALTLGGCGRGDPPDESSELQGRATNEQASATGAPPAVRGWDLQSGGEGIALVLLESSGETVVRLFCPTGRNRLLVNVPALRAVGSEERLSFGSGGEVVALVADSRGDAQRGGVSGTGPVPDNLARLIGGPVSINYGAQDSGPHPAPPAQSAGAFAAACSEAPADEPGPPSFERPPVNTVAAGACRRQDGEVIPPNLVKAVGTEPFWAARVEGRCVTYVHPDDQSGTRVWTTFSGTAANGTWAGSLNGRPFVMKTIPQAGCSDGMSDKRYPIAVRLTVSGEQRSGCAEPR